MAEASAEVAFHNTHTHTHTRAICIYMWQIYCKLFEQEYVPRETAVKTSSEES